MLCSQSYIAYTLINSRECWKCPLSARTHALRRTSQQSMDASMTWRRSMPTVAALFSRNSPGRGHRHQAVTDGGCGMVSRTQGFIGGEQLFNVFALSNFCSVEIFVKNLCIDSLAVFNRQIQPRSGKSSTNVLWIRNCRQNC